MSIMFAADGECVWYPGNHSAHVFRAQCESAAQILGVRSGIGVPVNDEIALDVDAFDAFVRALSKYMLELPPEYAGGSRMMLRGCFAIAVTIHAKLGRQQLIGVDEYLALGRQFVE